MQFSRDRIPWVGHTHICAICMVGYVQTNNPWIEAKREKPILEPWIRFAMDGLGKPGLFDTVSEPTNPRSGEGAPSPPSCSPGGHQDDGLRRAAWKRKSLLPLLARKRVRCCVRLEYHSEQERTTVA